jgi:PucR family transcriptional regulator, purine catabolism regulatory protein
MGLDSAVAAAVRFGPLVEREPMLTVRDIATMPGLGLEVMGGSDGLDNPVSWLHVSELEDPTEFLEGGEFLLTTGLGVGELASTQRAYVRRLAEHGLAGLGFGLGFGFAEAPSTLLAEADRLGFPIVSVPYEVPFIAITKTAVSYLANEQLEQLERALAVHERLADAVLEGRGVEALLAIVCNHLDCSLALVDESGRIIGERHAGRRHSFEGAFELPVAFNGGTATLKAVCPNGEFGEYDRLVLHHGQTAIAFELARSRAVSAAELRLAGDLLEDLEEDRLEEREAARRLSAFGLEPASTYAALLAVPRNGGGSERLRHEIAAELDRRAVRFMSTARRDRAEFLVEVESEQASVELAQHLLRAATDARVAVGRPGRGRALGRSLLEARAALDASDAAVSSYRDLGSLELLLGLPDAALEAFVARVLGPVASDERLLESLTALLECGGRWSDAASQLGIHRHTLRYRMERLREQAGRHPDEPREQMELWLAVKARQALDARAGRTA